MQREAPPFFSQRDELNPAGVVQGMARRRLLSPGVFGREFSISACVPGFDPGPSVHARELFPSRLVWFVHYLLFLLHLILAQRTISLKYEYKYRYPRMEF